MKLHYLEALCSALVVGLGQIIKREGKKGILLLLIFYFALPAIVYVSLLSNGNLPLFALGFSLFSGIILWVYSVADALLKS